MSEKKLVLDNDGGLDKNSDLLDEALYEDGLRGGRSSFGAEDMSGLYAGLEQAHDELYEHELPVGEDAAQRNVTSGHFFSDHNMILNDVGAQGAIAGVKNNFESFFARNEADLSVMMLNEAREEEQAEEYDDFDFDDVIGAIVHGITETVAGYEAVVVVEEAPDPAPVPEVLNVSPVAQDDAFTSNEGLLVTGNVLDDNGSGVDTDADGDSLSVVAGTYDTDNNGTITIAEDGSFTYTPITGYSGADSFSYTLQDGQGGSDIGVINFTLNDAADIMGNDLGNQLFGDEEGPAGDTIDGNGGDDYIGGGVGADVLNGGSGDDTLVGGAGADVLTGGTGSDSFVYWTVEDGVYDTITDFTINDVDEDVLELSDMLGMYDSVTDALTDFLLVTDDGTDTYVSADMDGGGDSFVLFACLEGITGLTAYTVMGLDAPGLGGGPGPAQPF